MTTSSRGRFKDKRMFKALVWRYDTAFEEKWLKTPQGCNQESILGTEDIQSMADLATRHDHVERMPFIPCDVNDLAVPLAAPSSP